MKTYRKLIRDRIPEIIAAKGEKAVTRILGNEEFAKALAAKLVEEAQEVQSAVASIARFHELKHESKRLSELSKEIGDVMEAIDALVSHFGLDRVETERVKAQRLTERGGFAKKIFLESVE